MTPSKVENYFDLVTVERFDYDYKPSLFDTLEDYNKEFVSTLAAVSRGKENSNNPNRRYKSLMKETASKTPSRPLEFEPVILDKTLVEDKGELEIALKYGFIDKSGLYIKTNRRAVLNNNLHYAELPNSDLKRDYVAYRLYLPNGMWDTMMVSPILSVVSSSNRVVDGYKDTVNEKYSNYPLFKRNGKFMRYMVIGAYKDDPKVKEYLFRRFINPDRLTEDFMGYLYTDITGDILDTFRTYKRYNIENNNNLRMVDTDIMKVFMTREEEDGITATFELPKFIADQITTHQSFKRNILSSFPETLWIPEDLYDRYEDKYNKRITDNEILELAKDDDISKIQNLFKELKYPKEIYQRYPDYAVKVNLMFTAPVSKETWEWLFKERNVLNYSKANWTQKETTEAMTVLYNRVKEYMG